MHAVLPYDNIVIPHYRMPYRTIIAQAPSLHESANQYEYREYRTMPLRSSDKVLHPELSYKLVGLLFEVHNTHGRWRNEKTYADALEEILKREGMTYEREMRVPGEAKHPTRDIIDFVVEDKVVVEFKAKPRVSEEDYAQVKRYLSAAGTNLGLLVNFRQKHLSPKRVVLSGPHS